MSKVESILPPPFEWVKIPMGTAWLEDGHGAFHVPEFMMAKYPLTHSQYATFIAAGGYQEKKWWTAEGWAQRERHGWTEPRDWRDARWNGDDLPVVGVSWFEAVAFCQWLGATSEEPVTLPTEQQWQRAAQGGDARLYPWGSEWDGTRCNNAVSPQTSEQTTPVTHYLAGASPYGVMDMSGNVWEWCLNDYANPTNCDVNVQAEHRVMRGGAWGTSDEDQFRVAYRGLGHPAIGYAGCGFRCARAGRW